MAEKYSSASVDSDPGPHIGSSESLPIGSDFCLLYEDDIEVPGNVDDMSTHSYDPYDNGQNVPANFSQTIDSSKLRQNVDSMDVETMKRKAEELVDSLRKSRSNRTSNVNLSTDDYEPPEGLERYREGSLFLAQKLKEDRLLLEESKKRNEAVVDKVRTVKKIHKTISESAKELRRDDPFDETRSLKVKIDRLEASLSHLQEKLAEKSKVLLENDETIRTLNETVDCTRASYQSYVAQTQEEMQQLKNEHLKTLEKISNSRDEFCNQLQTVRKKYLAMENNFKLSEFSRYKLVRRNAELHERVNILESELKIPHSKLFSEEEMEEIKPEISTGNYKITTNDLYPRIDYLATITNEFLSCLAKHDCFTSDEPVQVDEDRDLLQNIDKINDQLESAFGSVSERFSDYEKIQEKIKSSEEELRKLQASHEEAKSQETKLKKISATMKAKIQSETNINKELMDELSKAREHIKCLEQSSSQDWLVRYQELENTNKQLQYELGVLQNNFSVSELSSAGKEDLEFLRQELEAKIHECENLRRTCEQLEDSNDKLEHDFVVLQRRDFDEEENWKRTCAQLKDENKKLLENMRSMSEKAIDFENERLRLYRQMEDHKRIITELTDQLQLVNKQSVALQDSKLEHDSQLRTQIENLNAEFSAVSTELDEVKKQLEHETLLSRDLREQMQFAENTNATLSHEIHDLQKRNQELETAKTTLEEDASELKKRMEHMEKERTHLQQCIEQSDNAIFDYERVEKERLVEFEQMKSYNQELCREIEELNAEKEDIVAGWEEYKMKVSNEELNVEALKRANEELVASVRQLRQQVGELEGEKEQLTQRCYQYEAHMLNNANDVDREALEIELEMLKEEKKQLMERYEQHCEKIRTLSEKYQELEFQFQDLQAENHQLKSTSIGLKDESANDDLAMLQAENCQLKEDCEKFKSKYQRLQVFCKANINKANVSDGSNTEIESWKRKYNELKDAMVKAEEEINQLKSSAIGMERSTMDDLNTEVVLLKQKCDKMRDKMAAREEEMIGLKQLIVEYERTNDDLQMSINVFGEETDGLKRRIIEYETANHDLQTTLTASEEAINKLQQSMVEYETLNCNLQTELTTSVEEMSRLKQIMAEYETINDNLRTEMAECNVDKRRFEVMIGEYEEERKVAFVEIQEREENLKEALKNLYGASITLKKLLQTEDTYAGEDEVDDDDPKGIVNVCVRQINELNRFMSRLNDKNRGLLEKLDKSEEAHSMVNQLENESYAVRMDYSHMEQRLSTMSEEYAKKYSKEIERYEGLLKEKQADLDAMQDGLTQTSETLQQRNAEFINYRNEMESHNKSEQMKYESLLAEYQQCKRSETVDAVVQVDDFDMENTVSKNTTKPVSIKNYFQSNENESGEQFSDYSNWILPEPEDEEFKILRHQQELPELNLSSRESGSLDKSSQTKVDMMDRCLQAQTYSSNSKTQTENWNELTDVSYQLSQTTVENQGSLAQTKSQINEKTLVSEIISQLRAAIIDKMSGDQWEIEDVQWSNEELDVGNENFVNTSFKFLDLFETVVQYYSSIPQGGASIIVDKFRSILGVPESKDESVNHRETYNQLVIMNTRLECKNKYLVDAVIFIEESILARHPVEIVRFQNVLESWRIGEELLESDIIDKVCEEYDIIPSKIAAGDIFTTWKETIVKAFEIHAPVIHESSRAEGASYADIEPSLVVVMKKNHKLIGDLYYKYRADKNFDPNEFFDQIDDINQDVERLVKFVCGEISVLPPVQTSNVASISHSDTHLHEDHDHDDNHEHVHDHDHSHHEHEHVHEHSHHDHRHVHDHDHSHHDHDHVHDLDHSHSDDGQNEKAERKEEDKRSSESETVTELKVLLAESNKKIDSLVRELMEAKNSKDYNEMQQLHAKLDETLYQLHLRDVHVVELTRELTELLSERDALQLKLSSIIRQNEQLRGVLTASNQVEDASMNASDLDTKLKELHDVNYMRDPRISETSKQYHATGMQLFSDDQTAKNQKVAAKEESAGTSGFSVPSLIKWITGDVDDK